MNALRDYEWAGIGVNVTACGHQGDDRRMENDMQEAHGCNDDNG